MNRTLVVLVSAMFLFAIAMFAGGSIMGNEPGKAQPIQQKVVAAWQARERASKSFTLKWKETQTFLKGSLTSARMPKGTVLPAATLETDAFYTFLSDGNRMKEVFEGAEVSEKQQIKRQKETMIFDGEVNKSFRPPDIHEYPQGYIGDEKHLPGLNVYNLRPVLLFVRPFRFPQFGYFRAEDLLNTAKYTYTATRLLRGHKCVVVSESDNSRSLYEELWLDLGHDFVPLRDVFYSRGKVVLQIDWTEYKTAAGTLVPVAWKIQEIKGAVRKVFSSKALAWALNSPIAPDEFKLDFPAGTWVVDRRSRDKTGNPSQYIVKATGKRVISPDELASKTYQELNAETTGLWMLPIAVFAITGIALILFCYKRRKKHVVS